MENTTFLKKLSRSIFVLQIVLFALPLLIVKSSGGDGFGLIGIFYLWSGVLFLIQLIALSIFIISLFKQQLSLYSFLSVFIFIFYIICTFLYIPQKNKADFQNSKKTLTIDKAIEIMKLNDRENDYQTVERVVLYEQQDNFMSVFGLAFNAAAGQEERYTTSVYFVKNEPNRTLRSEYIKCGTACKNVYVIDADREEANTSQVQKSFEYLLSFFNKIGNIWFLLYE